MNSAANSGSHLRQLRKARAGMGVGWICTTIDSGHCPSPSNIFSSPAKEGNTVKNPHSSGIQFLWTAARHLGYLCSHTLQSLGIGDKKYSLVRKPCSPGWALGLLCKLLQGSFHPLQMLNSNMGWEDTIWESLESQLWLHVYMSKTLSC